MFLSTDTMETSFLWNLVKENPNRKWDWDKLSMNPTLTPKFVDDNIDFPWDNFHLSQNPVIATKEFVSKHINRYGWDYNEISKIVSWELVLDYPNKPWDWPGLSENANVTWEIVQDNPKKPWDWKGLSRNPNVTWEVVCSNPDKPWNYFYLTKNPNITWEVICSNPQKDPNPNDYYWFGNSDSWDWRYLSYNVSWETITNNLEQPWVWSEISSRTD